MARIAGVDLPKEKRVEIGLTYIYGIGRTSSNKILAEAKVLAEDMKDPEIKAALERGEIKQIVALIAYLNSLGQKRRAN